MVVDLLEKDRVNIKDLTIPEGKPFQPIFDPQKEVTQHDWESLLADLYLRYEQVINSSNSPARLRSFTDMAVNLSILDPDKKSWLKLDNEILGILKNESFDNNLHQRYNQAVGFAANARVLYPQETDVSLGILPVDYIKIKANYLSHLKGNSTILLDYSYYMAILFSERRGDLEAVFSQVDWSSVASDLRKKEEDGDYLHFAKDAKTLRLIAPKQVPRLNQNLWQKLYDQLEYFRRVDYGYDFAVLAASLTILSAKGARITEQGSIEIIPAQAPSEIPQQAVPTTRKF